VYAYAARGIGPGAGFLAGWGMLLDYVLMPALVYVLCAIAIQAIFPGVPRALTIVAILGFNTTINLLGIEATARLNAFWLAVSLTFIALFVVLALTALANGVAGAHLSWAPLLQPAAISSGAIFAALSVATLAFLGFDGISTLVEEARGRAAAVGRATLLALCLATLIFVVVTYLASLFVLDRASLGHGEPTDAAIYSIAEQIGGPWFKFIASSKVLFAGTAAAAASQVATARLLFSMARDGRIPRLLARVHPRRRLPGVARCGNRSLRAAAQEPRLDATSADATHRIRDHRFRAHQYGHAGEGRRHHLAPRRHRHAAHLKPPARRHRHTIRELRRTGC